MDKVEIKKIWIDKSNRLCIQPKAISFEMIYRSAMGVYWNASESCLYPQILGSLSEAEWYQQIIFAVKDEYRYQLYISNNTQWENIDETLKQSITIRSNLV